MNQEEQFLNLEDFILLNKIGEGGFGEVYIVVKKNQSTKYVAKISKIPLTERNEEFKLSLKREVNLLAQIDHPYVVKFIGYSPTDFLSRKRPVIITEFLSNGSLYDIVKREKNGFRPDSWTPTKKLINIFGIATIMLYLHSNDIIHRDLKLDNILLDDYLFPKIADFGLSKVIHTHKNSMTQQSAKGIKGTVIYNAPEIFKDPNNAQYSRATDVYAFAFIVYEIMNPTFPFQNKKIGEIIRDVKNKKRPEIDESVPKCFKKMIQKCWNHNPEKRKSFEWIVKKLKSKKEFIAGVDSKEFFDYVNLIENSSNNHIDLSNFTKINIGPSSVLLNNNDELYNMIAEDTKQIIESAKSSNSQIYTFSDDESLKLFATRALDSTYFKNILSCFTDVTFELKSTNNILSPILQKLLMLYDKNLKMIKVRLLVSDVSHLLAIIENKNIPISIKIEETVKSIPNKAFYKCQTIYRIDIPSSVKSIGDQSFYECEALEEIIIPSSVESIGIGSFEKCHMIETIEIIDSEESESKINEIKENTFKECESLIKIILPRSIKKINNKAFEGCKMLNEIEEENFELIEYIGEYSFSGCFNLNNIFIPNNIHNINEGTFQFCSNITELNIPKSITTIETDSFNSCTNLKKITFENPSSLISIKDRSFKGCSSLEKIIIPSSVEEIGKSVFERCINLKEIEIEANITIIEEKLFKGCKSLTEMKIPASVIELGKESFCLCLELKNIELPNKLKKIDERTFSSCRSIETIEIPKTVQEIGHDAFARCSSLQSINIPTSIENIETIGLEDKNIIHK